jgi:hypothetical protein
VSYRHDRRRKLIRRYEREGWREIKGVTSVGSVDDVVSLAGPARVFTAAAGTLPSVGGMEYAARRDAQ